MTLKPGFRLNLWQIPVGLPLFLAVLALGQTTGPQSIVLSTIVRDFISVGNTSNVQPPHPHFNANYGATCAGGVQTGIVDSNLNVTVSDTTLGDHRNPKLSANPPTTACMDNPALFSQWYADVPGVNRKFKLNLNFTRNANGMYEFDDQFFFPLDPGKTYEKFNAADPNPWNDLFTNAGNHNFGFTLELHTEFTYIPGQIFEFTGDDDVFVFINGKLMMDIGGIHNAVTRTITLDAATATRLGMTPNHRYNLDFFFAERHVVESHAKITTNIPLQQPNVNQSIVFVDSTGRALALNEIYEPTNPFLYIRYIDENPIDPNLKTKQLTLNIENNSGKSVADLELVSTTAVANGDSATWLFKIPLAELVPAIPRDQIAETYILGVAKASVVAHDADGVEIQPPISHQIRIAYINKPLTLSVTPCADSSRIDRTTTCVSSEITNQPLSKFPNDSLLVTYTCSATGDQVTVAARKTTTVNGVATYVTEDVTKTEGAANLGDLILSCLENDEIITTVTDPVYNERITDSKTWTADGPSTINFALPSAPGAQITATSDGVENNSVLLIVGRTDPTPNVVDQISSVVTTSTGETENITLTETGPNSGVFVANIPFAFIVGAAAPGNNKLEFVLDTGKVNNDGTLTATYNFPGAGAKTATIQVASLFNKVLNAWVKDENSNGQADKVYFQFNLPLTAAPVGINPIYWNSAASPGVMPPPLTLVPGTGNLVAVADFSATEFPKGLTGAGNRPYALFPPTNVFGAQQPELKDSLGPIINTSTIRLFDAAKVLPGQTSVGRDTLTIVLSEPLKDAQYLRLLKYSTPGKDGQCSDGTNATTLQVDGQPMISADGLTMVFIVSKAGNAVSALPGNCVYLTTDGQYVDLHNNIPAKIGSKLIGPVAPPKVEVFRAFPPVVGIDINNDPGSPLSPIEIMERNKRFQVATNDPKNNDLFDYTTTVGDEVSIQWIPPADFYLNPNYLNSFSPEHGYIPRGGVSNIADLQGPQYLPNGISTIQVVTTTPYIADVAIFDNLGNHVTSFRQSFGYMNEFSNSNRIHYKGFVSYLVWNLRDKKDQRVGQGVYIWKVTFSFDDRSQKVQFTKMGVVRSTK